MVALRGHSSGDVLDQVFGGQANINTKKVILQK